MSARAAGAAPDLADAVALQRAHRFDEALVALDEHDAAHGANVPALRLRATIRLVRGEYAAARRAAGRMALAGDHFGAFVVGGIAASDTGSHARADEQFAAAMARAAGAAPQDIAWCLTAMAENAARSDRDEEARILFEQALQQVPDDAYAICAFADFLLAQGDAGKALDLVAGRPPSPGFALRRALAENALGAPQFAATRTQLEKMLLATEDGGLHLREHARFELEIAGNPARAVALARRNWSVQRERADTLLVLRAARAAGDRQAADEVAEWTRATGFRE